MTLRDVEQNSAVGASLPIRLRHRNSTGLLLAGIVVTAAALAPWFAPYDSNRPDFEALLASPGASHWLGADELGRDVLSRLLVATRVSLCIGTASVVSSLLTGAVAGMSAGYFGRWIDDCVMRALDVISAFPAVLLALAMGAALGPGLGNVIVAIAVVNLPIFARLARAQTLWVRELGFVEARRALGFDPPSILLRTIAPNILPPLLTQASVLFGASILLESYLSFLGVGIQPPTPTLGRMLHDAIGFLDQAPWLACFPGCAIFLAVLGFNLLGDAMNDNLDPREVLIDFEAGA